MAAGVVIVVVIAVLSFFVLICSLNMYKRRGYGENKEGHQELQNFDSAVK
jgi:hypothetical protein